MVTELQDVDNYVGAGGGGDAENIFKTAVDVIDDEQRDSLLQKGSWPVLGSR